jgi:hypothetical protein
MGVVPAVDPFGVNTTVASTSSCLNTRDVTDTFMELTFNP